MSKSARLSRPERFRQALEQMPIMLAALLEARKFGSKDRLNIPKRPGVYLFSEGGRAIYVGQTRKLRNRYDQHTGADRKHNQASFAFRVARAAAEAAGLAVDMHRKLLQEHELFVPHFTDAKKRVAAMDFQWILNEDPVERSLFEIYAALHLGTEQFNSFETH